MEQPQPIFEFPDDELEQLKGELFAALDDPELDSSDTGVPAEVREAAKERLNSASHNPDEFRQAIEDTQNQLILNYDYAFSRDDNDKLMLAPANPTETDQAIDKNLAPKSQEAKWAGILPPSDSRREDDLGVPADDNEDQ